MKFLKITCSKCGSDFTPTHGGLFYTIERYNSQMVLQCDECCKSFIDKYTVESVSLTKTGGAGGTSDSVKVILADGTIIENIRYNYFPENKLFRLVDCKLPEYAQQQIIDKAKQVLNEKGMM